MWSRIENLRSKLSQALDDLALVPSASQLHPGPSFIALDVDTHTQLAHDAAHTLPSREHPSCYSSLAWVLPPTVFPNPLQS